VDIVRPYWIGEEITTRSLDRFIVDFNDLTEEAASLYEAPFSYIAPVKLHRAAMNQPEALHFWWRHWNSRPKMRAALSKADRYIATPRVAKHRLFVWLPTSVLPDCQIVAIARSDDTTFGVLHSRFHEIWTLRMCTYLGVGNDPRYTPSTTFETFPFPEGMAPNLPSTKFAEDPRAVKIATCAKTLNQLRQNWLNPPELIEFVQDEIPEFPARTVARNEKAANELKKRTLTNLYNARPSWLSNAHDELNAAVAEAYGWPANISDDDAVRALIGLNRSRGRLL
jgi:type II restriction/modification system DNA methylase subunit YeeA